MLYYNKSLNSVNYFLKQLISKNLNRNDLIIGVGGGIFLSPLLILKGWGTAKTVAATSAVFIWANSFAGLLGVIVGGRFDLDISILGPFILCVILGGFVGAKFGAGNSSQNTIRRLLALVLFLAALRRTLGIFGLWV